MDDEMLETLPKQHVARFALSTFPSFSYRRGTLASASFCCCVARAYPLAPVGSDARASADGKPPGPLYKSPDAPAKRPHKTIRTSICVNMRKCVLQRGDATHFGAASRAAAAGARRTSYGATTNAIRAGFCFPDAARGCIQRDAAAGCGGRRARELRISSCERTWRPVDDAKPTQRCRVGRSSEDHDDGSAACTCSRD
jgi:hypothetical protein